MQDSLLESDAIPLGQLEDPALQKLTKERLGKILSNSAEEKDLQDELDKKRDVLFRRLRELHENPFHNIDHAFAVHGRLSILLQNLKNREIIPKRRQLLLLESALRHDDAHVGNRYRQDIVEDAEMSNEELAVMLMESDFRDSNLMREDITFMRNAILATSSWQLKLPKKDRRQRDYSPRTLEEKLLVFADVGEVLIGGWGTWQKESEGIDKELWKHNLRERNTFFSYVVSLYSGLKDYLNDRLRNRIEDNIREVEENLLDTTFTREPIVWRSKELHAYQYGFHPHSIEKKSGDTQVFYGKLKELGKNPQLGVYDSMKSEGIGEDDLVMQINEFYPNGRGLDEASGEGMRTGFGSSMLSYLLRQALLEGAKGVYVGGVSDSMGAFLKKNGFSQVKLGIYAKKL